jgi:hypothetical protein
MALTTFSGPVKSNNGFINQGAVTLSADTTITVNDHAGRVLNTADADGKFTLPTITSDNIGSIKYVVSGIILGSGTLVTPFADA